MELFKQLEEDDLETLGVSDTVERTKVLAAVALLPEPCDVSQQALCELRPP